MELLYYKRKFLPPLSGGVLIVMRLLKVIVVALLISLVPFCTAHSSNVRTSGGTTFVFSVLAYGAVCDGSTDDQSAFTSAVAAANTAGGGVVLVPAGKTCALDSPVSLQNNVTLSCDTGSILKAGSSYSSTAGLINATAMSNVSVTGCAIDMEQKNGQAIKFSGAETSNIFINKVHVYDSIGASGNTYNAIEVDCVAPSLAAGEQWPTGNGFCTVIDEVTVTAPRTCLLSPFAACTQDSDCGIVVPYCNKNGLADVTGIKTSGTGRTEVTGSIVKYAGTAGIHVTNDRATISENYVLLGTSATGILAGGSHQNISSNDVEGSATVGFDPGSVDSAYYADSSVGGSPSTHNIFRGNNHAISGNTSTGYLIHGMFTLIAECSGKVVSATDSGHVTWAQDSSGVFPHQSEVLGCILENGVWGIKPKDEAPPTTVSGNPVNIRVVGNLMNTISTGVEMFTGVHVIGNTINWGGGADWGDAPIILGPSGLFGQCTTHSVIVGNSFHGFPSHSMIEVPSNGYRCTGGSSSNGNLAKCTAPSGQKCSALTSKCNSASANAGTACSVDGDCNALPTCSGGSGCTQVTCQDITITGNMFFMAVTHANQDAMINFGSDVNEPGGPKVDNVVITGNFFRSSTTTGNGISFPSTRDSDFTNLQIGINTFVLHASASELVNWDDTMGNNWITLFD